MKAERMSDDRVQEYANVDTDLAGVNLSELVKFYKEHIAQQNKTVSAAAKEFMAAGEDNSPIHQKTVRLHLTHFCERFRGQVGHIRATDIDKYLKDYFPNLKTRLNHRITICSMFRFAQRKGYLPVGPTEAEKSERPKVPISNPEVVSPSDLKKLLGLCEDKKIKTYLLLGAFAGCRTAEIQRLKWSDFKGTSIILGPGITKTNRRRIAEISPNLQAWLKELRGKEDEFVSYPESEAYTLHKHCKKLCRKAKVKWKPNGLRHAFVSCHLELHRDPSRTSKTAGHSLYMLETCYLKLVDAVEAAEHFDIFPPVPTPKEHEGDRVENPLNANQTPALCLTN